MTATSRVLAFLGMPAAVLGAVLPWLPGIPGTAVPFAALAAPHAMAVGHAGIGVGWAVIAAAAVGALAALLRGRAVLGFVATVQLLLVADFLVLQAIRSAPGDYTAADIPAGCWTVLASALAALVACLSSRPPSRPRPGACQ